MQREEEETLIAMCWKTTVQSLLLSPRGLQDWKASIVLRTWLWAGGGRWWKVPLSPQEVFLLLSRLLLLPKLTHLSHFPGVILSWDLWPFQIEASLHNNLILKHNCHLFESIDFPPDLFGFTSQPQRFIHFCFISIFSLFLSLIPNPLSQPNPHPPLLPIMVITPLSLYPWGQVLPLSWAGRKKECGPTGSGLWKFLWKS